MNNHVPYRVLVIEDDKDTRANLCDILELDGYHITAVGSVKETLAARDLAGYSAIILDRKLPDGSAEDLLPSLRELAPDAGIIIVTGYADVQGAIAALRQGAMDYILKPINAEVLRARLEQLEERAQLAAAKRHSETAFRTLVEAAPSMIVILRADNSIFYFSPFAEQLTGFASADILGKDFCQLLPQASRRPVAERVRRVFANVPCRGFESQILCRDGGQRWMVWNFQHLADYEGAPALLGVGQDITNVKEAQERALQAERLAAIGQMVAGLTHESGNALARCQACLEMLALEVEDRPEALDLIGRAQKAQDHLRQLYEDVRGYAAPIKLQREIWDVGGIWRQAWQNLTMLRKGRDAVIHEQTHGLDLHCSVDHFRLEQVFRNIMENTLAACKDPVVLEVTCTTTHLDGKPALHMQVCDNGPGLSPEQRQRIFEPFFTTKTKGTGLGMAIAKRIVEAHQGLITVGEPAATSSGGGGARIHIILPRE
jgi:PAS domain S-box-containing protein